MLNDNTDLWQLDAGRGVERMAIIGSEQTSSYMLDWEDPKGKTSLEIVMLLRFLRNTSGQKKDYRYKIKTNSDEKGL